MRSGAVTKQTFLAARLHVVRQRALDERRGGSITAAHVCGAVHKVCDQRASEPQNASPNDSVAPTFRALQFFRQMNMDTPRSPDQSRTVEKRTTNAFSCKEETTSGLPKVHVFRPVRFPAFQATAVALRQVIREESHRRLAGLGGEPQRAFEGPKSFSKSPHGGPT